MKLLNTLLKEQEQGRYIIRNGETITEDKLRKDCMKEYNKLVKDGQINPYLHTCQQYFEWVFNNCPQIADLLNVIEEVQEEDAQPEQAESVDTVG